MTRASAAGVDSGMAKRIASAPLIKARLITFAPFPVGIMSSVSPNRAPVERFGQVSAQSVGVSHAGVARDFRSLTIVIVSL